MKPLGDKPLHHRRENPNQIKRRQEIKDFLESGYKYAELEKFCSGYSDIASYQNACLQLEVRNVYVHIVNHKIIAERTDL